MFVTLSAAEQAVKTARGLSLTVPAQVLDAEEFSAEVSRLAAMPDPPRPPLPDRPEQLAGVVREYVIAAQAAAHERAAAATYTRDTSRILIAAVQAAVPAWVSDLIPMYADARDAFTYSAPRIPTDATPDTARTLTPAQFKHWQKADRAAYRLDTIVKARRDFHRIIAEPVTGRFADLAAASEVTRIPGGTLCRTTWEQVSAGLKTWRSKGDPIARWRALTAAARQADLRLTLADTDDLQTRADRYEEWLERMLATAGRAFATT